MRQKLDASTHIQHGQVLLHCCGTGHDFAMLGPELLNNAVLHTIRRGLDTQEATFQHKKHE